MAGPDPGLDQARRRQGGLLVEFAVSQLAAAFDQGRLVRRTACAGLQQIGQDFIAQQLGLVRSIQDIGVPCQVGNIVHRRQQIGLGKHMRAEYIIFGVSRGVFIFQEDVCIAGAMQCLGHIFSHAAGRE